MSDNNQATSPCVLIVDDDREVRDINLRMLKAHGFQVREAANGPQALTSMQEDRPAPDLILLDLNMPGMNGSEVLRSLRQANFRQPVVITSGFDDAEVRDKLGEQSAQGYLHKPYRIDDLIDIVKTCLKLG